MPDDMESNADYRMLKLVPARKAAGMFVNFYISNEKNHLKDIEDLAESITNLGLEKLVRMYDFMRKEIQVQISTENYRMAHEIQKAINFYRKNVLYKAKEKQDILKYVKDMNHNHVNGKNHQE